MRTGPTYLYGYALQRPSSVVALICGRENVIYFIWSAEKGASLKLTIFFRIQMRRSNFLSLKNISGFLVRAFTSLSSLRACLSSLQPSCDADTVTVVVVTTWGRKSRAPHDWLPLRRHRPPSSMQNSLTKGYA